MNVGNSISLWEGLEGSTVTKLKVQRTRDRPKNRFENRFLFELVEESVSLFGNLLELVRFPVPREDPLGSVLKLVFN